MSVRVVHCSNELFVNFPRIGVGTVRRVFEQILNIPPGAEALICGNKVGDDRVLCRDEVLEFSREQGTKGLGALLTPEELQEQWKIDGDEYEELLVLGLPFIRFTNEAVRHPEFAVDEFMRQLGDVSKAKPPELVGTPYVAERLGCTTVWVTELIRKGGIPVGCIAPGTGNGKPWKFVRVRIEEWLKRR